MTGASFLSAINPLCRSHYENQVSNIHHVVIDIESENPTIWKHSIFQTIGFLICIF